jgi:hypothetical protein
MCTNIQGDVAIQTLKDELVLIQAINEENIKSMMSHADDLTAQIEKGKSDTQVTFIRTYICTPLPCCNSDK